MKSRQISVAVGQEQYRALKEMAAGYQVSLSALAAGMIDESLSGKKRFEESTEERLRDLSRRMGKMAYRNRRTEILIEEILFAYLLHTPEISRDDERWPAMKESARERRKKILAYVSERLREKDEAETDPKEV